MATLIIKMKVYEGNAEKYLAQAKGFFLKLSLTFDHIFGNELKNFQHSSAYHYCSVLQLVKNSCSTEDPKKIRRPVKGF